MQEDIFSLMYPKYVITKPIRFIELFGGYGSQHLALKYLGIEVEHWKLVEWAVKSIQAYKDLHYTDINIDYSKGLTKEEMVDYLFNLGISSNYNEPMTYEQIKRINEIQLRNIYNNIKITKNLVNIQNVKGRDLEIVDTDKYDYILTYSFPCQDLSLAGKRKGMSDTSTRSGMLWEVERILSECKEIGQLPKVLLMENVPQVHSTDNLQDFNKWQLRLEELGYKNYWQDLIATNYGIPQIRNRTFMISLLGDYSYTFPKPIKLKIKLKDLLENNVDEKYFLSDRMINFFYKNEQKQKEKGNGFRFNVSDGNVISKTITTRAGSRMDDNFIQINSNNKRLNKTSMKLQDKDCQMLDCYNDNNDYSENMAKEELIGKDNSPTLTTRSGAYAIGMRLIKDTKNYIEWKEKGKIDMDCRAFKEDKVMSTIMTTPKNKVVLKIPEATKKGYALATDGDGVYINRPHQKLSRTILANKSNGGVGVIENNLRIRKLTPKECFRLMGVKDEDYERIAKNQSNISLYHLAGDSIVVNVLMAIFKQMVAD